MRETPKGAILQRDKETYAIVPRTPVGLVKPEDLENIVKVVRKYDIPIIKITSGQRFALVGLKEEDVEKQRFGLVPYALSPAPLTYCLAPCALV